MSAADAQQSSPPHTTRMVALLCAIFSVAAISVGWKEHLVRQWRSKHPNQIQSYTRAEGPAVPETAQIPTAAFAAIGLLVIVEVTLRRWSRRWLLFLPLVLFAWVLTIVGMDQTLS